MSKWQMRFEEDLVELLSPMGHPPQDTVKLVVQSLTSTETQVLEDVPMTEANRQAIKAAVRDPRVIEPEASDTSKMTRTISPLIRNFAAGWLVVIS